jgi:23S rRNA (adenine2503-C2)-methyltransferase
MPVAERYTIEELLAAVDAYMAKKGRKVMFEYLMISGVNDKDEHARELARLLRKRMCVVNLIAYNDTGVFKATPNTVMKHFKEILEQNGIEATVRYKFGNDINGACGQLVTERKKKV